MHPPKAPYNIFQLLRASSVMADWLIATLLQGSILIQIIVIIELLISFSMQRQNSTQYFFNANYSSPLA